MTPETKAWLDEVEARAEKATIGPWANDYDRDACLIDSNGAIIATTSDREWFSTGFSKDQEKSNAEWIAKSRTDLPLLVKVLREAFGALEFYSKGGNFNRDIWVHEELGHFTGKRARETQSRIAEMVKERG